LGFLCFFVAKRL